MNPVRSLILLVFVALAGCGGGDAKLAEHLTKGKALLAEGKHEAAADELLKATALDKNSMDAWLQLGHAYAAQKKNDVALAAYVAAKRIDRNSIAPHVAHAKVQISMGHIEHATTELNFVVEMDPKNIEALLLLGQVSQMPSKLADGSAGVSKESYERAELNLEAAATLAPQNAQVQLELVKVYVKRSKRAEAEAALKKLASLADTDAGAKKLVAEALTLVK